MKTKDLKKLTRTELLEMLLQQVEENEALRRQVEELQEALDSRTLVMQQSGSMAEAALKLNGVFDQAQQAADDYLRNIQLANAEPEAYSQKIRQEAQAEADAIIAEARSRSDRILAEADETCISLSDLLELLAVSRVPEDVLVAVTCKAEPYLSAVH